MFPAISNPRDQFFLLMRALDTLSSNSSSSLACYAYFTDVCLAFARFDCCLKSEERRLFLQCFDRLSSKLLSSVRKVTGDIKSLQELRLFVIATAEYAESPTTGLTGNANNLAPCSQSYVSTPTAESSGISPVSCFPRRPTLAPNAASNPVLSASSSPLGSTYYGAAGSADKPNPAVMGGTPSNTSAILMGVSYMRGGNSPSMGNNAHTPSPPSALSEAALALAFKIFNISVNPNKIGFSAAAPAAAAVPPSKHAAPAFARVESELREFECQNAASFRGGSSTPPLAEPQNSALSFLSNTGSASNMFAATAPTSGGQAMPPTGASATSMLLEPVAQLAATTGRTLADTSAVVHQQAPESNRAKTARFAAWIKDAMNANNTGCSTASQSESLGSSVNPNSLCDLPSSGPSSSAGDFTTRLDPDHLLLTIDTAVLFLEFQKAQVQREAAMLCFRFATTVVDLLLPTSHARGGESLVMFYRKWICDIYRTLVEEDLLGMYQAILSSTQQPGSSSSAVATPDRSPQLGMTSRPQQTNSISPVLISSTPPFMELKKSSPALLHSATLPVANMPLLVPGRMGEDADGLNSSAAADESESYYCVGSLFERSVPVHQDPLVNAGIRVFRPWYTDRTFPTRNRVLGTRLLFSLVNGARFGGATSSGGHGNSITTPRGEKSSNLIASPERNSNGKDRSKSHFGTDGDAPTYPTAIKAIPLQFGTPDSARPRAASLPVVLPDQSGAHDDNTTNSNNTNNLLASSFASQMNYGASMLHHHAYKYPAVKSINDVRALYEKLVADCELSLTVHDPIRAAIINNAADCIAGPCGDPAAAMDLISQYLEDISLEAITLKPASGSIASNSSAAAGGGGGGGTATPSIHLKPMHGGDSTPPPQPSASSAPHPQHTSAFSVTVVGRALHSAFGGSSHTSPMTPPTPPSTQHHAGATAALILPQKLYSWNSKEERSQFFGVIKLLKASLQVYTEKVATSTLVS